MYNKLIEDFETITWIWGNQLKIQLTSKSELLVRNPPAVTVVSFTWERETDLLTDTFYKMLVYFALDKVTT